MTKIWRTTDNIDESLTVAGVPIKKPSDLKTAYKTHMKTAPMGPTAGEVKAKVASVGKKVLIKGAKAVNVAKDYYSPTGQGGQGIQKAIGAGAKVVKNLAAK